MGGFRHKSGGFFVLKASIEMFEKPMDDPLWQLVALSAGTGGSLLAVGSVAGHAESQVLRGEERFGWDAGPHCRGTHQFPCKRLPPTHL